MSQENEKTFTTQFKVGRHECDSRGVVIHALYTDYLEQARSGVLMDLNFPFEELKGKKLGFVVLNIEVEYLASLIKGDEFIIETTLKRISKLRLQFAQIIYRLPERTIMVSGANIVTTVDTKYQPCMSAIIENLLTDYPVPKKN